MTFLFFFFFLLTCEQHNILLFRKYLFLIRATAQHTYFPIKHVAKQELDPKQLLHAFEMYGIDHVECWMHVKYLYSVFHFLCVCRYAFTWNANHKNSLIRLHAMEWHILRMYYIPCYFALFRLDNLQAVFLLWYCNSTTVDTYSDEQWESIYGIKHAHCFDISCEKHSPFQWKFLKRFQSSMYSISILQLKVTLHRYIFTTFELNGNFTWCSNNFFFLWNSEYDTFFMIKWFQFSIILGLHMLMMHWIYCYFCD